MSEIGYAWSAHDGWWKITDRMKDATQVTDWNEVPVEHRNVLVLVQLSGVFDGGAPSGEVRKKANELGLVIRDICEDEVNIYPFIAEVYFEEKV